MVLTYERDALRDARKAREDRRRSHLLIGLWDALMAAEDTLPEARIVELTEILRGET